MAYADIHYVDVPIDGTDVTFSVFPGQQGLEIEDSYVTEVITREDGKKAIRRYGWKGQITEDLYEQIVDKFHGGNVRTTFF